MWTVMLTASLLLCWQQFPVAQSNGGLVLLVIWPWPITTWDRSRAHTRAQTKKEKAGFELVPIPLGVQWA